MQLNLQSRAGAFLMLGSLMIPLASSFNSVQPLAFRSTVSTNKRTSTNVHQHMLPPDALLNAAADPAVWDHFTSQLVAAASAPTSSTDAVTALAFLDGQSTQFLADATVEVADKATWWQSYLAIFKGALNLVHSTIDQPLRSVGIEQTWGVSIAIFTAGVRSVLVPLSIQQTKSAEYMKALKPYMADIKEKFKDNQDAQNRATAKLYEDAKQNPLAGCFVSLAQLPVFLGLYRGVRLLALDGDLTEPFLWIPSLQGPVSAPDYRGMDWLTKDWTAGIDGALPHPSLGWETTIGFLIMPVILVLLQTVTMKTLQPPVDENSTQEERETMEKSQSFLKFLPLLIGFFSLQVPAALTIYWFTSNLFTLSQSLAVKAYFAANPPQIELPEYWDTALGGDTDFDSVSPADRRKAAEAGIRVGPSFEDMVDESRFHCLVERKPVRNESAAWQRAQAASSSGAAHSIPSEMESWVQNLEPAVPTEATVV